MINYKHVRKFAPILLLSFVLCSCDKSGEKCPSQGDPCGSAHGVYATKQVINQGEDPCICRCQGNWELNANGTDCECNLTQADCPTGTKLDVGDCECLPGIGTLQAMLSGSQINGTVTFAPTTVEGTFDETDSAIVLNAYKIKGQEFLEIRIPHAKVGAFNTNVANSVVELTATHRLSADTNPFSIATGQIIIDKYEWFTEVEGTFSMTLDGLQGSRTFTNGEFSFHFPQ